AQLGQRAEALDELALDPHHPPRVGVQPVGVPVLGEQPLVGGLLRDLRAAQRDRALAVDVGLAAVAHGGTLDGPLPGGDATVLVVGPGHGPPSVSQASSAVAQARIWSVGQCSSSAWASAGSPGPKFTAGTPSAAKRATSVHPYLGAGPPPVTRATAAMKSPTAGSSRPG